MMRPSVFSPTGTEMGAPVFSTDAALQTVTGAHGDGAHHAVSDLLLHLEGQAALDLQRVVHLGHRTTRKFHVHDGADDFNDAFQSSSVLRPCMFFNEFKVSNVAPPD